MIGSFPKYACRACWQDACCDHSSPFCDSVRARRSPTKVYDSVAAADWLAQTCGDILTHWAYDHLESTRPHRLESIMMGSANLRKDILMCAEMRTITLKFKRVKLTGDAPRHPFQPCLLRCDISTAPCHDRRDTEHSPRLAKPRSPSGVICRYQAIQKRFR
jgi:hypothetical protein